MTRDFPCLIMASGRSSNFGGFPKQNLVFDDETLLQRQVRQFKPHCSQIFLITHRDELFSQDAVKVRPPSHRWKNDTLLSVYDLWKDGALVIHGDVRFTDESVTKIVGYEGKSLAAFWDGKETFALMVPSQSSGLLRDRLSDLVESCMKSPKPVDSGVCGFRYLIDLIRSNNEPIALIEINDETQDFDSWDEYNGWFKGWRKNRLRKA